MIQKFFICFLIFILNFRTTVLISMQVNSTKHYSSSICKILWPLVGIIFKERDRYKDPYCDEELEIIIRHIISKVIDYAHCNLIESEINVKSKFFIIKEDFIKNLIKYIKADLDSCIRNQNQEPCSKKILEYNLHNKLCRLPIVSYFKKHLNILIKCSAYIPNSSVCDIHLESLKNNIILENYLETDFIIKDIYLTIKSRLNPGDQVNPKIVLDLYYLFKNFMNSIEYYNTVQSIESSNSLIFEEITRIITQGSLLKSHHLEYNGFNKNIIEQEYLGASVQSQYIIRDLYDLFFRYCSTSTIYRFNYEL